MKTIQLLLLLFLFSLSAQAQTDSTLLKLLGMRSEKFRMAPPDSTFTPLDNGYENPSGATVVYQLLPVEYKRMLQDMDQSSTTDSIVFHKPTVLDNHSGYLVKFFYKSPDASYEDMYGLLFFFPYKQETINLTAAYPVSQDGTLYPKLLRTFGSLRRVEP